MDTTFIKTSEGIIRTESITFVETDVKEDCVKIYLGNAEKYIRLTGKEAQSFVQVIPIAVDISFWAKTTQTSPNS